MPLEKVSDEELFGSDAPDAGDDAPEAEAEAAAPSLQKVSDEELFGAPAEPKRGIWDRTKDAVKSALTPRAEPPASALDDGMAEFARAADETMPEPARPRGAGIMYDTLSPQEQSRARLMKDKTPATAGPIEGVEATAGSIASDLAKAPVQGMQQVRGAIQRVAGDLTGSKHLQARGRGIQHDTNLEAATERPDIKDETVSALYQGVRSVAMQAPMIGLGIATGGIAVPLAGAGALTAGEAYGKYRDRGATPMQAAMGALGEGAVEMVTELMPMAVIVQKFGRATGKQFLTELLAKEIPGEQAATLAQDAIDTAIANPNKTWQQYVAERPEAAWHTLLATVAGSATMAGASQIARAVTGGIPPELGAAPTPGVGAAPDPGAQPGGTANLEAALGAIPGGNVPRETSEPVPQVDPATEVEQITAAPAPEGLPAVDEELTAAPAPDAPIDEEITLDEPRPGTEGLEVAEGGVESIEAAPLDAPVDEELTAKPAASANAQAQMAAEDTGPLEADSGPNTPPVISSKVPDEKSLSKSPLLQRIASEGHLPPKLAADIGLDKSQLKRYSIRSRIKEESGPLFRKKGRIQPDKLIEILRDMDLMSQAEADGNNAVERAFEILRSELTQPGSAITVRQQEAAMARKGAAEVDERARRGLLEEARAIGIETEGRPFEDIERDVIAAISNDWTTQFDLDDISAEQAHAVRKAWEVDPKGIELLAERTDVTDEFLREVERINDNHAEETAGGRKGDADAAGQGGRAPAPAQEKSGPSRDGAKAPARKPAVDGDATAAAGADAEGRPARAADRRQRDADAPGGGDRRTKDRRQDLAGRKEIDEMDAEELRREIQTSDLTGLPNRRAWKLALKRGKTKAVIVSADIDAMKWVNDNMSHESGDELIAILGLTMGDHIAAGDAFHISGDEFYGQFDTNEQADRAMAAVRAALADVTVEITKPDGTVIVKKGIEVSYGKGANLAEAEVDLQRDKDERKAAGIRGRPEPLGVTRAEPARRAEASAEGLQAQGPSVTIEITRPVAGTYVVTHDGREIARANLNDDQTYVTSVRVEPEFRRKGVATRLYDHIEHDIGRKLVPSPTYQTPDGRAFLQSRAGRPSVIEQERAIYGVNEPEGSGQVEIPLDWTNNARLTGRADGREQKPSAVLRWEPTAQVPGLYLLRTELVTAGKRKMPVDKVATWSDAVKALSWMANRAVEHWDGLVTDKDGNPLAVIGAFKGTVSQTSVYPHTVIGELSRIKGAAHLWSVHNHPSGMTTLSQADKQMSAVFAKLLAGSSVTYHGIAAVSQHADRLMWDAESATSGATFLGENEPMPTEAPHEIDIVERTLVGMSSPTALRSPQALKDFLQDDIDGKPKFGGANGILFLDFQNKPTAFVPFEGVELGLLRHKDRFMTLMRAASEAGGAAAIFVNRDGRIPMSSIQNAATALAQVDIRTLDVVDPVWGRSAAEQGISLTLPAGADFAAVARKGKGWYSPLNKAVEAINAKAMPVGDWIKQLNALPQKGVSRDELDFVGVLDWLEGREQLGHTRIPKEEITAFLNERGVKLTEDVLGGLAKMGEDARAAWGELVVDLSAEGWHLRQDTVTNRLAGLMRKRPTSEIPGWQDGDDDVWDNWNLQGQQVEWREAQYNASGWLTRESGWHASEFQQPLPPAIWDKLDRLRQLEPFVRNAAVADSSTKYSRYTEKGGKNYREFLVRIDLGRDEGAFTHGHWPGHKDIVFHVRVKERVDENGKRVLFVEEVQSDWAQQGRKRGFIGDAGAATADQILELAGAVNAAEVALENAQSVERLRRQGVKGYTEKLAQLKARYPSDTALHQQVQARLDHEKQRHHEAHEAVMNASEALRTARNAHTAANQSNHDRVPKGPWVHNTDAWVTLALKRILRLAAEEGFDRVAFTTGKQQQDRYSLSRHISKVEWETTDPGDPQRWGELAKPALRIKLRESEHGRDVTLEVDRATKKIKWSTFDQLSGHDLKDVIGEQLAERIYASEVGVIDDLDFTVGGEGMRSFYDEVLPKIATKVLRKLGGPALDTSGINTKDTNGTLYLYPEKYTYQILHDDIAADGTGVWVTRVGDTSDKVAGPFTGPNAYDQAHEWLQQNDPVLRTAQLGFDITEPLRERVLQGLPMFAQRWYSPLNRAVEGINAKTMPAENWIKSIGALTTRGVSKMEIEFSGVIDWLQTMDPKGKVPKEQVTSYLNQHGLQVGEVVYGGPAQQQQREAEGERDDLEGQYYHTESRLNDADYWIGEYDGGLATTVVHVEDRGNFNDVGATYRIDTSEGDYDYKDEDGNLLRPDIASLVARLNDLRQQIKELNGRIESLGRIGDTHYPEQTLKAGGVNYREVLLTGPTGSLRVKWGAPVSLEGGHEAHAFVIASRSGAIADQGVIRFYPKGNAGDAYDTGKPIYIITSNAMGGRNRYTTLERAKQAVADHAATPEMNRYRTDVYTGGHWSPPGVIAHLRTNDRRDADGKRVLFVEEVQSDIMNDMRRIQRRIKAGIASEFEKQKLENLRSMTPYPTTDAWVALVLKRIIRMAAEEGYDRVAFTTGAQQEARYSLAKKVERIDWRSYNDNGGLWREVRVKTKDEYGDVIAMDVNAAGYVAGGVHDRFIGHHLSDVIGAEVADKIMADVHGEISGLELDMGGLGMAGFYDDVLPKILARTLAKLGGPQPGTVDFDPPPLPKWTVASYDDTGITNWGVYYTDVLRDGRASRHPYLHQGNFLSREAAEEYANERMAEDRRRSESEDNHVGPGQLGFDVTPELRDNALKGMPLTRGGDTAKGYDNEAEGVEKILAALAEAFGQKAVDKLVDQGILRVEASTDNPHGLARLPKVRALYSESDLRGPGVSLFWDRMVGADAAAMLMHEIGTHFGLHRMLSESGYRSLMDDLRAMEGKGHAEVDAAFRVTREHYVDTGIIPTDRDDRFLEEVAAYLAERAPSRGWVQRLFDKVRAWVRSTFGIGTVDGQLIRGLTTAALHKAVSGKLDARVRRQMDMVQAAIDPSTDEFKRWFADSKVVDEDGNPLMLYHGTLGDFDAFDPNRASPEGAFGAGFYFTNEPEDAAGNYGNAKGQDVEIRLERRVDEILNNDEFPDESWYGMTDFERKVAATELARAELGMVHGGATVPVYLRMRKPFVIGGSKQTYLDAQYPYDEATEEYGEPTGPMIDFIEALRHEAARYDDAKVDGIVEKLMDDFEGVSATRLIEIVSADEGLAYAMDEQGKYGGFEIVRAALERAGFDGIIDHLPSKRWPRMEGMHAGVVHYIAFNPSQIKSAIGNAGSFNPYDANILAAARPPQPNTPPARLIERDPTGLREFGPGRRLYDKLAGIANDLLRPLALNNDNLDPAMRAALRKYWASLGQSRRTIDNVAKASADLTPEERSLLSDVIERELAAGVTPPEHVVRIATQMQGALSFQTDQLLETGMLSQEAAERWRGQYLPRFYAGKLGRFEPSIEGRKLDRKLIETLKIAGNHLKGRGIFERMSRAEYDEKYAPLGWEIRGTSGNEVIAWRDFTKEERTRMGEIRDGMFRFARGYLETQKDIAMGRLLKSMSENPDIAQVADPGEGWVRVPDVEIEGTGGVKRYGALSGMYVRKGAYDQIVHMREVKNPLWATYLKALSFWKEGKTVWNPVSHGNNVASNFVAAHMGGLDIWDAKAYAAIVSELKNQGRYYIEAVDNGLLGTEFVYTDLSTIMPTDGAMSDAHAIQSGMVERAFDLAMKYTGTKMYRKVMQDFYGKEDQFFKLGLYRAARMRGASVEDAIAHAERFVFNYADLPKGARIVRDAPIGLPFFSYVYKAIPMVASTAMAAPHRLLPIIGLGYGANYAAYAFLFGDDGEEEEKRERAHLPKYMQGLTALGIPKALRTPFTDVNGNPVFYDISRRLPLGDFFDVQNQAGGLPIPQWAMPNNPLFSTLVAMVTGNDLFFGRPVVEDYETPERKVQEWTKWIAGQALPAAPFVPGSYQFDKLLNGVASVAEEPIDLGLLEYTGTNRYGDRYDPVLTGIDLLGIAKLRAPNLERESLNQSIRRRSETRKIDQTIRRLGRDQSKTDGAVERERERLLDRREQLLERGQLEAEQSEE